MLLLVLAPLPASARCGVNQPASYDDIDAVLFRRAGCNTLARQHPPQSIVCSRYRVFFSQYGDSEYDQFDLPGSIGKFKIDRSLSDAVGILKEHNFLGLAPPWYY